MGTVTETPTETPPVAYDVWEGIIARAAASAGKAGRDVARTQSSLWGLLWVLDSQCGHATSEHELLSAAMVQLVQAQLTDGHITPAAAIVALVLDNIQWPAERKATVMADMAVRLAQSEPDYELQVQA